MLRKAAAGLPERLRFVELHEALRRAAELTEAAFAAVLQGTWYLPLLQEAYRKAVERLKSPGDYGFVSRVLSKRPVLVLNVLRDVGGRFISPKVLALAVQLETALSGVSRDASQRVARELQKSFDGQLTREEAAKNVAAALGSAEGRAATIVRTETTRAYAEGQLDAMEEAGVQEVKSLAEWTTIADACDLCEPMDGQIISVQSARGMIPRHPNCRCAWYPYDGPSKHAKALARRAATRSLRAEGVKRKDSDWAGAEL